MGQIEDYLEHARREMFPKMKQSALVISVLNAEPDAKQCLELGAAILFEKPLVILALRGGVSGP